MMTNKLYFPAISSKIGLYPIVDSADWVKWLVERGVTTIQLRIKDRPLSQIEAAIEASICATQGRPVQLFINDYWQLALKYRAFGVHLGQEDLLKADLVSLREAGLRLGVSTHSDSEINIALACHPSYIAFGPIYHTSTKVMPYDPQGLKKLADCCRQSSYPVVAIGGLNAERIPHVLRTGVDGVAVLSAITQAKAVEKTLLMLQQIVRTEQVC